MKKNDEELMMQRHSMAHVLAKALEGLYENISLAIGPAIDTGFYYDVDMVKNLTPSDYAVIEKKMKEILNKGEEFRREEISKEEALKLFKNNKYKVELINDLPENEVISVYYLGDDFVDLCRGPHVLSTKNLQNFGFKVYAVNGAYWRGSEKNKMLQRVYCYGFKTKQQLNDHILAVEDAKKRDHNKIGRELEYFTTVDVVGQGLPILLPKGSKVISILKRFVEDEEEKRGYQLTMTPSMTKNDLFKISGHWDHYKESMFVLGNEEKDREIYCLRPMTCPFQYQVFLNKGRSYRDLPMRLNETSTLFRNESSGECHGLIRLRQFTISEGHLIVTPEQLEDEFKGCLDLAKFMLEAIGLDQDITYRLSKWDINNKEKYIGNADEWESVQDRMRDILVGLNVDFEEADGEAAFYGPKLDIQMKNVHGKEDTIITIQIDFQIAKMFEMEYIDENGQKAMPYIIHRTSIGCYERTLAYLLEKYAGALPLWLSPEQVRVLSLTDRSNSYVEKIIDQLKQNEIRAKADIRNEKIGYKIREALNEKVPYLIIVGDEEEKNGQISIRGRKFENKTGINLSDFIERLKNEIKIRKND